MTEPSLVRLEHVSKQFRLHKDKSLKERLLGFRESRKHVEEFWALRDITMDITLGSTVGLTGHNGSGKSTLLKTIGGIISPTEGNVYRRGRLAALLELGAGFHPDLTGRENVYLNASILGLNRHEIDRYFDAIVDFSGIEEFIDTQVKFYSSGMYVRLAFSIAIHVDPDLLLVDEVLAVGDEPFQRKCLQKIADFQREGRTIVLVSHSAAQVEELCDRVVVMHQGSPIYDGETTAGLKILRSTYERDRLAARSSSLEAAQGPTISDVRVISDDPIESITVFTERPLNIAFTYVLPQDFDGQLTAGVAIDTNMGHPLRGADSRDFNLSLPTTAGTHRLEFSLPRNDLPPGPYSLRAALESASGKMLDSANPASLFSVETESSVDHRPTPKFSGRIVD